MHSSISVSLEPGLDRGVPWGRDLYTFVTSAAGHMMRTLQKPRKNRPSKRQVNHRRFLHNMIQRKFADIEAANHRLASALYFKVDEKKPKTPEQAHCPLQNDSTEEQNTANGVILLKSKDCITIVSTETGEKKQPDHSTTKQKQPKSKTNKQTQNKTDQSLLEFTSVGSTCVDHQPVHFYGDENSTPLFSLDTQEDLTESTFLQFGQDADSTPSFSPELSPLSLDSCDLSVQMFTDISSCTPAQKSFGEITESQWADIIDLFSTGSKEFGGSANVEAYFESICECHSDAEEKICTDDELGDFFCAKGQCKHDYSCDSNQTVATNHFMTEHFTSDHESPSDMHNFLSSISGNIFQNELPSSANYQFMLYQHPLQQSQCTLEQYQVNPAQFEGVAQSFSAPSHNAPQCSIPTPPHEGDWLFTDILTDTTLSLS